MRLTKAQIKYLRSLSQKKFRDVEKKFILEGWRQLSEVLSSPYKIEFITIEGDEADYPNQATLFSQLHSKQIPIYNLSSIELNQISNIVQSQGVIALIDQYQWQFDDTLLQKYTKIVACENISDPGNLGGILRTCDWFGIDVVILSNGCVSVYNEKVVRSTAGSLFHIPILENIDLVQFIPQLKNQGFSIIGTSLEGKEISRGFSLPTKAVLVLGSEAHGISNELSQNADSLVKIPSYGRAESLNVGIACGILLAYWRIIPA